MQNNKIFTEMSLVMQGEGIHIGTPSILLREYECNLRCGFCDSKFSWKEPPIYSIQDAIEFIHQNSLYSHIIFTGGEPLIHQDEIVKTLVCLTHDEMLKRVITIETNCTIEPILSLKRIMSYYKGLWSVSPKQVDNTYLHNLNKIRYFNSLSNIQFKFVIDNPIEEEIKKVCDLVSKKYITKPYVIVQPNGMVEDYNKACRELAEYVISNNLTNLHVLPQFHKICWGNMRGV